MVSRSCLSFTPVCPIVSPRPFVTVNRRAVWKLINELKQNRIVILTTHSMEEGTHRNLVPTHLHSEVAA